MSGIATSFRSADDKPLHINKKKSKDIFEDLKKLSEDDLVKEIEKLAKKGKRKAESVDVRKKTKRTLSPIRNPMCSTSLYSPETSNTTNDAYEDEWSDCDEKELSKSINLFNQSVCNESVLGDKQSTEKEDSALHGTSYLTDINDDNTQWEGDDDELLLGVSLIETSFSSAKPDRSVLQEISNLSWTDQSESSNQNH